MINEIHRLILKEKKSRFKDKPRVKRAVQGVKVRQEVFGDGYGDKLEIGFNMLDPERW